MHYGLSRWCHYKHYKNTPRYRINNNSIFIDDKIISEKTDTNCNDAGGIGWRYMSITRAEGIEHGCVSVEQQALLCRQSTTAKIGNEVREKSSVRCQGGKEQRTAGQRKRTESYGNAT